MDPPSVTRTLGSRWRGFDLILCGHVGWSDRLEPSGEAQVGVFDEGPI